jgi:hypothetical protein
LNSHYGIVRKRKPKNQQMELIAVVKEDPDQIKEEDIEMM